MRHGFPIAVHILIARGIAISVRGAEPREAGPLDAMAALYRGDKVTKAEVTTNARGDKPSIFDANWWQRGERNVPIQTDWLRLGNNTIRLTYTPGSAKRPKPFSITWIDLLLDYQQMWGCAERSESHQINESAVVGLATARPTLRQIPDTCGSYRTSGMGTTSPRSCRACSSAVWTP